jgi:hypothetical protein
MAPRIRRKGALFLRRCLRRVSDAVFGKEARGADVSPPRLKPVLCRLFLAGVEQAAEKVKSSEENCEIHPSAAKADINPIDLSARVNSCPFKTALCTSFSAACETPASLRRVEGDGSLRM